MAVISLLAVLFLVSVISSEVVLFTDDEVLTVESVTAHFWNGDEFLSEFNVSGLIVLYEDGGDVDVEGKIVLYPCSPAVDTYARSLKEQGAVGVIAGSCSIMPFNRAGLRFDKPRTALTMNVTQVNETGFKIISDLLDAGEVFAIITSEDPSLNPNTELKFGGTVLMIFGWTYFTSMLILTIVLLVFELRENTSYGIKTAILIILIFSFALGIFFTVIDPIGSRNVLPYILPMIYQIFNVPVMIMAELLVSIFWFDSVKKSLFTDTTLLKTRIPFLVLCVGFALCVLFTAILAAANPFLLQRMIIIIVVFYTIAIFSLAMFHLIVGTYLYRRITKVKAKAKLKKTSFVFIYKIFGIVFFDLLQVVGLIIFSGIFTLPSIGFVIGAMIFVIAPGLRAAVILSLFTWSVSTTSRASTGNTSRQRSKQSKVSRIEKVTTSEDSS